jgi:hypothetical protein
LPHSNTWLDGSGGLFSQALTLTAWFTGQRRAAKRPYESATTFPVNALLPTFSSNHGRYRVDLFGLGTCSESLKSGINRVAA